MQPSISQVVGDCADTRSQVVGDCIAGHSFGFMVRTTLPVVSKKSGRISMKEHLVPIVLTNTSVIDTIDRTTITLFQMSGTAAAHEMRTSYPRFCKMVIAGKSGLYDEITLSIVGSPIRKAPLLYENIQLVPREIGKHIVYGPSATTKGTQNLQQVQRFVEDCITFYNRCIPEHERAAEVSLFVLRGGVQPMIEHTPLSPQACKASVVCEGGVDDNNMSENTQGCHNVEIPSLNASSLPGITDEWAPCGGDPGCVPLQLNSDAVTRCNSVLYGCTMLERAMQASESSRVNEQLYKEFMENAYDLIAGTIGGGMLSKKSSVYVDRFNAILSSERERGWCEHPKGGVQKIHPLVNTQHVQSTRYTLSDTHAEIPVVLLDNIALFHFQGELSRDPGVTATITLRTKGDLLHILQNPKSYGGALHCTLDDSLYMSSHQKIPLLVKCKNYSLVPKSKIHVVTDMAKSTRIQDIPYSMALHTNETVHDPHRMILCAMNDWVCCVTSGKLIVQTDSPALDTQPIETINYCKLKDALYCLIDAFSITYIDVQTVIEGLGTNVRTDFQITLETINTAFVFLPEKTAHLSLAECVDRVRKASDSVKQLVELVILIEKRHSAIKTIDTPDKELTIMTNILMSYQSRTAILAKNCIDLLRAATEGVFRCVQSPDACLVQSGSMPYNGTPMHSMRSPLASWGSFSKMRPMFEKHRLLLGNVKDASILFSYPRKACVMVRVGPSTRTSDEDDFVVLMIDRYSATDPEYFSSSEGLAPIKERSSVRNALSIACDIGSEDIRIRSVYQVPTFGKRRCHTSSSVIQATNAYNVCLHGRKLKTLVIEWTSRTQSPQDAHRTAIIQVNTCSTDRTTCEKINDSWAIKVLETGL